MNSYLEKAKKKVLDLVKKTIDEHFFSYFLYGFKLEELKKSVENLEKRIDMIERRVDDEFRNSKDITKYVSKWLVEAKYMLNEYDKFWKDEHLPYTKCCLTKPWLRYRLAKKAYRLVRKVNNLCKTSFSDGLSYGQRPMSIDFLLSIVGFESFNSRKEVTENITENLKDARTKMVGVYGTGGVGKTTLIKEVANEAQRKKVFDLVIFATVTTNPNIKEIQGQLADQLGARLNEETENGRASRLRDIFKKEKKNILVVLDDLWAELDLNELGIPVDDANLDTNSTKEEGSSDDGQAKEDATSDSKMLKVLLTSRSKEVVFDKMHVKESSGFHIKGLEDKEAEDWFKKMVGMVDKPPAFGPLATQISNKCGGLPITIVTIGKTLRTKSISQWKETLVQLERQDFTELAESVDFSTRLSFKYLENEMLKSIFLLCAQLGHHPPIMELVKYCIGVGIFEGILTIKETREKVLILIKKLKDSSLLLDSYSDERFNMHDMIREIALSIASEEHDLFIMRNGKLKEWPRENKFKKYKGISIYNCDIIDKLPNSVSCPRLEIFHVDTLNPSFNIPKGFLQRARQLRALILTRIDVSKFCASIGCLTNLRMLCLEKCKLSDLSFIGKLEKLRILSLSGSSIEHLSSELGKLHKLQLLDINNCSELREISPNVLSRLTSLEELYMRNCVKWVSGGNQSVNHILAELKHLRLLKNLDICLPSIAVLPRNLCFNNLDSYNIVIGDFETHYLRALKIPGKDEASRVLSLQIKEPNVIHDQEGVKMLFRGVEKLFLRELNGVRNIFSELGLEGFPCLKELSIQDNYDIEYIIDPKKLLNLTYVFPILESLRLDGLMNLMNICYGTNLRGTSFSRLKVVRIHFCDRLANVFSHDMVSLLENLETIDISSCSSLKTIVLREGHVKMKFPKIRSLALRRLYKFNGVYANDDDPIDDFILFNEHVEIPNLESLELNSICMKEIISSQSIAFENLTKLNIKSSVGLQYLFSLSMAKSMKKLKCLSVSHCNKMVEIFKKEEDEDVEEEREEVRVFPKLEEIHLYWMESLTAIWPQKCSPESFTSLNSLSIGWCKQLVTVLPSHMVGRYGSLENLRISYCDSVKHIFDLNVEKKPSVADLQVLKIFSMGNLEHIWNKDPEGILNFEMLHSIRISSCDELKYLFPLSVAKGLQELESLSVFDCPNMEEIAHGNEGSNENSEFPHQVSVVEMQSLPKLKWFFKGTQSKWPKLRKLSLFDCDQLETFETENQNSNGGPIFLPEEIIPNLETMEMNMKEMEKLKLSIEKYCMNHLKIFHVISCHSIEILYQFLYKMPYLERLTLSQCQLIELISNQESINTFPRLKYLKLDYLNALENIGFDRVPILQYCLEHLCIRGCEKLINLAPSSVTLHNLTTLEVHDCGGMTYLMGFSTAKSLVQLVSLKVIGCRGLEEIVAQQNDMVEEITYQHEKVFSKLVTLELVHLPNLSCFCSFKKCDSFEFPSLEKLTVYDCPSMIKLCNQVCTAPNLQLIEIDEEEENWSWKGDLNDRMWNLRMSKLAVGTYLSIYKAGINADTLFLDSPVEEE